MPFARALRAPTVLAALAVSVALLLIPAAAHAEWQRRVNFTTYGATTYGSADSDASLQRAAADGNDSVEIIPTWFQQDATSTTSRLRAAAPPATARCCTGCRPPARSACAWC